MRLNPEEYALFIENSDIVSYCSQTIAAFVQEIDHVGMKALMDTIIVPAGLQVEIMYLDRSEGQEVNVHRFEQENDSKALGESFSSVPLGICLLYRP